MHTELELIATPEVPIEAECLSPAKIKGLSQSGIENLGMMHGNRKVRVGDFFRVTGNGQVSLRLEGDLSRVKYIGAGMKEGEIRVNGSAGMHLGAGMSGGVIVFLEMLRTGWAGDERGTDRGDGAMPGTWWAVPTGVNVWASWVERS